jgi:hypothetical protein
LVIFWCSLVQRLAIDRDERIKELNAFLKDDQYEKQRVNITAAISLYEQEILPGLKKPLGSYTGWQDCSP